MVDRIEVMEFSTEIISSYVSANNIPVTDLLPFIDSVYSAMHELGERGAEAHIEPPKPAVPIKRSIQQDYIVCLEDGKKFQSLKRHLWAKYGLTPDDYRKKWGLPGDYPMVAPNYAKKRSELAKKMGLGQSKKDG